jgi:hypothetical protein
MLTANGTIFPQMRLPANGTPPPFRVDCEPNETTELRIRGALGLYNVQRLRLLMQIINSQIPITIKAVFLKISAFADHFKGKGVLKLQLPRL